MSSMVFRKFATILASKQSPYRLVVRTSRCGRDNPGSTPGEDMYCVSAPRSFLGVAWRGQQWRSIAGQQSPSLPAGMSK